MSLIDKMLNVYQLFGMIKNRKTFDRLFKKYNFVIVLV